MTTLYSLRNVGFQASAFMAAWKPLLYMWNKYSNGIYCRPTTHKSNL